MSEFNVIVVGDSGIGKSTYICRFHSGEFTKNHIPTSGIEVSPLHMWTNRGNITLNCYDYEIGHKPDVRMDAAILMFDVTSKSSYKNLLAWYDHIKNEYGDILIILCGNKVDSKNREVKKVRFHRRHDLMYIDISAKSCYNFEKPFLIISRKLMEDDTLEFVEMPSI